MQTRQKYLWLWTLYDFANSIAYVNVLLYFGLWFISEHGGSDAWISASVAVSTIAMLFILPVIGAISDRTGRRMPFLTVCSLLCIGFLIVLGILMGAVRELTLLSTIAIVLLYTCFTFFYNSCFTFYNAFLSELTPDKKSMERISGLGMGMGQIGNVIGLALAIPFATGQISLGIFSGKPLILIGSGVIFLLCALPVFLFLKDKPNAAGSVSVSHSVRETLRDLRHLRKYPDVFWYLITYCLFADAMLTLSLFISSYLETVAHMPDTQKNLTFILAVFSGMLGAFCSPLILRIFPSRKKANAMCILLWTIVLSLFAVTTNPWFFTVIVVLNGCAYGALFALSRAFFATLIPEGKQAEMFGLYALFERTASVFGPLIWSGTALLFQSFGPDRYRFSILALTLLVLLSWFTLQKVREPKTTQ